MTDEAFKNVLTDLSKKGIAHVDCSGLELNDDQLDLLLTAMEHAPLSTKTLNLSRNCITSAGVPFLLRYLEYRQVDELVLRDNQIGEAAALSFLTIFNTEREIKLLDLHNNECTEMTASRLLYLSRSEKYAPEIRQALITGQVSAISFSGLQYVDLDHDLLQYLLVETEGLQSVDFSGIDISGAVVTVIGGVLKDSKLSALCLRECMLTNEAVMKLIESADLPNHEHLKSLDLSGNMNLTNDLVRKLIAELFDKSSHITVCDVSSTSITTLYRNQIQKECELSKEPTAIKNAVVQLRNNAPSAVNINLQWDGPLPTCMNYLAEPLAQSSIVERLNISNSLVDDAALKLLAQSLQRNTSLKTLELANCNFTAVGIKAIFEVLMRGKCGVQEVNIANNNLGEDAVQYIVAALQANPKLTIMNVDVNPSISENSAQAISGLTLVNRAPPQIRSILPSLENNAREVTAIDFSPNTVAVNDDSVWLLSQALRTNTVVRSLNLSHNSIGDRGATYLAALFRENSSVASLDLSSNSIGNRGAQALCDCFYANRGLQVVNLSNNVMDMEGVNSLTDVLRKNHKLREINMAKTRVPEEFSTAVQTACALNRECPAVKNAYYSLCDNDTSLSQLHLHNLTDERAIDDESMRSICSALHSKAFVYELDVSGNKIGAAGCAQLASVLSAEACRIMRLNLSNNPIDDVAAAELAKCFSNNTTLTNIDLRQTNITDAGAAVLAKGVELNSTLFDVNISEHVQGKGCTLLSRNLALNCGPKILKETVLALDAGAVMEDIELSQLADGPINDAMFQLLCPSLISNKQVRILNLSYNSITTASIPYVIEVVELCPTLSHLDLSHNKIDERGAKELVSCAERVTHLRNVLLTGNGITKETHDRVMQLVAMNLGSEKLKLLVLSSERGELLDEEIDLNGRSTEHQLTDEEIIVLAGVLRQRSEVKSLDLGNNLFSDAGCIAIAEVLRVNHTLEALNLAGNNIGADGGEALYLALKINPQLQCLNLDRTTIPREIVEDIDSLLHVNQTVYRTKVDMQSAKLEEISDETQFRSTDYHAAQTAVVGREALDSCRRADALLLE
ncbi:putative paraflagellar rod component [Leptomonas pyrrhocoris]|uniref:Putative paraflagellar rod component n=1 Tax=Leptomonas pyrrhocoris TaxID=157538 RepID=A0A0N0DW87_LEPPY|nr:putative paraflagellar rod component [Leptomonas pyrrhocoris]KPA81472.1 putative paraflagellar rod component [Leptomonas pyrrhocoris]|eukprot:XP_015659911.1 putative paraflagellar rod component [Leptomonas pyrrhocoris]